MLLKKIVFTFGTKVASAGTMKSVIEFPKQAPKDAMESARPSLGRKLINISEWHPHPEVQLANAMIDAWPFCAA